MPLKVAKNEKRSKFFQFIQRCNQTRINTHGTHTVENFI